MGVYIIDVDYSTHDDVKAGRVCIGTRRVHVAADTADAASCIAAQMVACHGFMPTATYFCI